MTGHNISNVNNPAYARQRLVQQASSINLLQGAQGMGVDVSGIAQLRSGFLDSQVVTETGRMGAFEAAQEFLEFTQTELGRFFENNSVASSDSASGGGGLAGDLDGLFNAFHEVSLNPSSLSNRRSAVNAAERLAEKLNTTDERLKSIKSSLGLGLENDVESANKLLGEIAELNIRISRAENNGAGTANDLRDTRQGKLEELGAIAGVTTVDQTDGMIGVRIGGEDMVVRGQVADSLETYADAGGELRVRTAQSQSVIDAPGGRIQGALAARDEVITPLTESLDELAATLVSKVNEIHAGGYTLDGTTGRALFNGSGASDIAINPELLDDPSLFQAAGAPGEAGNNAVVLQLAQLQDAELTELNGQTFNQRLNEVVTAFGEEVDGINLGLEDQQKLVSMLKNQRDSVSGVSLDEEVTSMVKFQKAYEASAKFMGVIDEMLQTVLSLKR